MEAQDSCASDKTPWPEMTQSLADAAQAYVKPAADGKALTYLDQPMFTSELFKIELKNFRPHTTVAMIKKRLLSLGLQPHKIKTVQHLAFVTFKDAQQRDVALTKLKGHRWRGLELVAKPAKPKADPFAASDDASSTAGANRAIGEPKRPRLDPEAQVQESVAPLARFPYPEQLARKSCESRALLDRLQRDIVVTCGGVCQPIPMLPIVASPAESGYRNKCQFTVAWANGLPGGSVVVGYRVGKYRDGSCSVYSSASVSVAPPLVLSVASQLESVLNEPDLKAVAPPYDVKLHAGCWKEATVRCNSQGQALLYLDVSKKFFEADAGDGGRLRDFVESRLRDRLLLQPGAVSSLHIVYTERGCGGGDSGEVWRHLGGEPDITESLGGFQFRVSPSAFFQVNTAAAAMLYERIGSLLTGDIRQEAGNEQKTGKNEDPQEKNEDPEEKNEDPRGKNEDPEEKNEDPDEKNEDPDEKNEDPRGKNENPEEKNEDPQEKNEDPQEKNEDPHGKNEDPQEKDEDPRGKNEDPQENNEDLQENNEDPQEKNGDPQEKKDAREKNNKGHPADKEGHPGNSKGHPGDNEGHCDTTSGAAARALLDVCCGTGTIGIALSRRFARVVGIELLDGAVRDALVNARLNGVTNAQFVCAKAEDAVPREAALLAEQFQDVAVVLDPPRSGVQPSVLATLRRCRSVRRLLYVSCSPKGAWANFLDLCRPRSNKWRGGPFTPTLSQVVDMFPMTEHCELLLLFTRDSVD